MRRIPKPRRGAAVAELALLLPFLAFIFVIAVDWSRIFYDSIIITNCARNGALYCSDPIAQTSSPYTSATQAALADASNLTPTPTVSVAYGTDVTGPYTEVTVSYVFQTISRFPGIPTSTTLVRKVRMSVAPNLPN